MLLNYRWFSTNSKQSAYFFWETTALSQPGERISKKMTEQLRVFSWWANRIVKGQKLSPQLYVSIIFPLLLLSLVTQGAKYSQKKPYCIYPSVFWWRDWTSACKMTFKGQMLNFDQGELRNPWRSFVKLSTYMYRVKVRARVRICDPNCFLLSTTNKQIQNTNKCRREGVWRDESTIMGS